MKTLVAVEGQTLRWYGKIPEIADNSVQFVQLEFSLPKYWADLVVMAQFSQTKTYNKLLENGCCYLPAELVAGPCEVSLFGQRAGETVRATSVPLRFKISRSGFTSTAETPIPPTPDLYAQLLEKLGHQNPSESVSVEDDGEGNVSFAPGFEGDGEDHELNSLNTGKTVYTSFPDKVAREGLKGKLTNPGGLTPGQLLRVKSVDQEGNILIEGVNMPSGGSSVVIDTTLTQSGQAADAKATGDAISKLSQQNVDQPWHYLELSEDEADAQANAEAITAAIAEHKYVMLKSGDYPVTGNIVIDSGHLAMNKARLFVVDPNHSGHIVELRGEKPTIGDGEIEGCFHTPYGDPNYVWREDEQCILVAGVNDAYIYNMDLHNVWGAGLATNHVYGERVAVDPKYLEGIAATNTGAGRCTFVTPAINIPDGQAYVSAVGNWGFNYIIAAAPVTYQFYDADENLVSSKSDTPRIRVPIPDGAKTVTITTICPTTEFISYYLYFTNYRENILIENTLFRHNNQAGWNNPCGPSTIRNCGFLDIGKPYPEAVVTNPKGGWGIDIEDQQCPQFIMDGCWSKGCIYMLIFGGYNGTVSNCHGDQIGAYRGWNLMLSNCVLKRLYTNSNGTDNIVTHSVYAETLDIDPNCLTQIHGDISTMRICSALSRFDRFTVAADTSSNQAEVAAGRLVGTVTGKTAVGIPSNRLHPQKGSDLCVVTPGSDGVFTTLGDSWGITSDAPWLPMGYVIRDSKFTVSYARKFIKDSGVESSGLFENCTFELAQPYFVHKQAIKYEPPASTILTFRDCTIHNDGVYLFNYKPKPGSVITFERCTVSDPTHIINPNGLDLSDITIRFLDYSPEEYTVLSDKSSGYDYSIIIRDGALVPVCRATGIEITTPPTKTGYTVGEELDLSGMVVSVLRQDGTKEEVSDYIAPTEVPSDGVVTISYTEFGGTYTASLTVTVTEAAAE